MMVLAELMVAEKGISVPFASVSFRVIKLPTFVLSIALSLISLIFSLKVNVMSESVAMEAVIPA